MPILMHIAYIVLYVTVACLLAVWLPGTALPAPLPAIGANGALIIGGAVLIVSAHLHLLLIQRSNRAGMKAEIDQLKDTQSQTLHCMAEVSERVHDQKKLIVREMDRREANVVEKIKAITEGRLPLPAIAAPDSSNELLVHDDKLSFDGLAEPTEAHRPASPDDTLEQIVERAIEREALELHLQPIVHLPDRMVQFYEAFPRVRDEAGNIFQPQQFMPAANRLGLTGAVDNLALSHCVRISRQLGAQRPELRLFYNLAPESLNNPEFLGQFVDFMTENAGLATRLVFESKQAELPTRNPAQQDGLNELGELGYGFSLDGVIDLDLDFADLTARHLHYVKVPAPALSANPLPPYFRQNLRHRGIQLIAEQVNDDDALVNALYVESDYGQGHVFGRPRISRDAETPVTYSTVH